MIAQYPVGPGALGQGRFIGFNHLANGSSLPGRHGHELEVEGQVSLVELRAVVRHQAGNRQIDLTDEYALAIVIQNGTHLSHNLMYTWQVFSVASYLTGSRRITWLPL